MKKTAITLTFVMILGSFSLTSCSTSQKMQTVQAGDHKLSCHELKMELGKLDTAEEEVNSKKGLTGTNVASALFWIPGLAYTYYDAGQALEAIAERRSHLTTFYNEKNCP